MSTENLFITVVATHREIGDASKETNEFDLMAWNSYDEFEEAIKEWLEEIEPAEGVDSKLEDWDWEVEDWGNVHSSYTSMDEDLFEYVNAIDGTSYDKDVVDAAVDCEVNLDDIDECYAGSFKSDEDFTENLCDDIGAVPKDFPSWIAIDWEETARNVMQDYVESDGHYFRVI